MSRVIILILFLVLICKLPASATAIKKEVVAVRVSEKPIIDGKLNDVVWNNVPVATDFIQFEPENGSSSKYKTEAKFIYTDRAVIIGVMMFDPKPDQILKELSRRDEINNSDFLSIIIDPFNNGLDAFEFILTPAGVQWDAKVGNNGEDSSWDGVWNSAANINENGWSAEIEIPYSALRFPSKDIQEWGVNIMRNIQRDREKCSWNFIDKGEDGFINQGGVLKGIENVKPPVRLSFSPYFSTYFDNASDNSSWDINYRGGMDLKYGINESYTLDMMLIPDFGQIQSDDEVLNLSPFEVKFDEKRQFFTEATELFDRGGVFYSRRIGGRPANMYDVEDNLKENESITENPIESKIINATKISGRNTKGLGIGVLNAMTKKTFATIQDTITGQTRKYKTQPFTNYNMFVFDQSLKNESYVSLFNTNLYTPQTHYIANVSGTEFAFKNAARSYKIEGKGIVSQRYQQAENDEFGHYHELIFEKIKGQFTWSFYHRMISDQYNPNDMGFLHRNNQINNNLNFFYNVYQPKGIILQRRNWIGIQHEARYQPRRFSSFTIRYNSRVVFKDHTAVGIYGNIKPIAHYDFNEPRVDGMKLKKGASVFSGLWLSSDYRKAFAIDLKGDYGKSVNHDHLKVFSMKIQPRYRFNDKFGMDYKIEWERQLGELGHADDIEENGLTTVYIGERNTSYLENRISANYIFNNKSSLSFRARHYWAKAEYKHFFTLKDNGDVKPSDYNENKDINFNSFNIDMVYSWRFAPGSELAVVWKNSIFTDDDKVAHRFINNLKNTFDATQFNSFSIKILYYIDYMSLKRKG
ncbi:DUF5916 domain-containing protein [Ancylomarina longa]|uniref:Uncharacterized protein n=1 Tax=Ancylomarina longa TaxID=2487017 RepID=A0A434AZH5_9BACT|nr:DUF5916 domain-containing protein [Ancylomarina longa]RUT80021.1 hypothetical protein DLK05_01305 [Ancylomarina longa]